MVDSSGEMFSFGVIGQAVLLVLGGIWCWEMFRRGRRDLDELRSSRDLNVRIAIAGLWAVTAVILLFWLGSVVGILGGVGFA